jgi:hypothetical protein
LTPPINGATAASGSPYFTQQPGQKLYQWDSQLNFQYMPKDWITWWTEATFRHSSVPYWSGSGGVTPPGGNNGSPATQAHDVLVDELAHSNIAEGEPLPRHAKRWQDVEELLDAGIGVWTTLNVQHLESLNDVIAGITGIRQQETLPDRIFDEADEVELIDLPPDDLLARLKAGKVYAPDRVGTATERFFRKSNCSRCANSRCAAPQIA